MAKSNVERMSSSDGMTVGIGDFVLMRIGGLLTPLPPYDPGAANGQCQGPARIWFIDAYHLILDIVRPRPNDLKQWLACLNLTPNF